MSRIVCQFSCGAASAVATKLALAYGKTHDVQIINAFIKEEHEDNRRFLADCERWFGRKITVLRNQKYNASVIEVFRQLRFLKSRNGAPCSRLLKREVLNAFRRPDDAMVIGYTVEEQERADNLQELNPDLEIIFPLIERGLTKADCLAIVERAGIKLPAMYLLGYNNANCKACVKGGEGYFNKIRVDFPVDFYTLADVQEGIGPGAYLFRDRKTGERYSLRELPPDKGRHTTILPDCGFMCELAEGEL